jgi:hypothetical protein
MKNIHILPTDKPSKLHYFTANKEGYYLYPNNELVVPRNPNCINQNIYITSDSDIKEGDWIYSPFQNKERVLKYNKFVILFPKDKKIILTTNGDLIKDGVQEIDDDFLEWFVKNPSCEEVGVCYSYKIVIPKEEPKQETNLKKHLDSCEEYQGPRRSAIVDKQETLKEVALRLYPEEWDWREREIFIEGAKWMQERSYSEEDMTEYAIYIVFNNLITPKQWFEQFKNKQNCLQIK